MSVTNEEQRETYSKLLDSTSDWLYDEGQDAPMADLKSKLDELHALQDPIERRVREFENRQSVLEHLNTSIEVSKSWVIDARKNYTAEPEDDHVFTEEQITSVETLANNTQVWLEETLAKQKELKDYEDPVLLIEDMISKGETLDRKVLAMERKRKLWKPKKVEKEEEDSSDEEETETSFVEEEEEDENGEKVTKTKKIYKTKTKKSKKAKPSSTVASEETTIPVEESTETPAAEENEKEGEKKEEKEEKDKEDKTNERDEL